jgi:hypothetical protein
METVKVGDLVKHKTISWMNGGKPFRVIKIEDDRVFCEYTGRNSTQYFHEFYIEQLIIAETAPIPGNPE